MGQHISRAPTGAVRAIILPECCDTSSARAIMDEFIAARGASVEVDASAVSRAGAQSLQVIIAAARTWEADGCEFKIVRPSDEFINSISLLGLN